MGVDLALLVMDGESFSHTTIRVERNRDLWKVMERDLRTQEVPMNHRISTLNGARVPDGTAAGESMYGRLRDTDAYGSPFTWCRASDLARVFAEFSPTMRRAPVTAYLAACTPDTMVILEWS